ncbi:MAG: nucleotidyltransferase domain-containing protein [Spirochaetia bacterium]
MAVEVKALLDDIIKLVLSHKNAEKVVLFGSRARGDESPTSDIDIAIIDPFWTREDINIVRGQLNEEIPTALKIDLVSYDLLEKTGLKERILKEGVLIRGQ